MTDLGIILTRLGLDQYHDAFVAEGFDTWETVLDVQENDLVALGFKRGHRRKLQREIANYRGISYEQLLSSPIFEVGSEASRSAEGPPTPAESAGHAASDPKRKYRRHPKPDVHAPQRPISSYVEFSNSVREEIRERNLSFTEIAKLVGNRWQKLTLEEKEPYESRANAAKERYNAEMAEYKNTEMYSEYLQYLADFKAKHGGPAVDPKRPKFEQESSGGSISTKFTDAAETLAAPNRSRVDSISTVTSATSPGRLVSPVAESPRTSAAFVAPHSIHFTARLPQILPSTQASPTALLLQEPRVRGGDTGRGPWAEDQASMREQPNHLPCTAQLSLLPSVNQADDPSPSHSVRGGYSSAAQDMSQPTRIRNPVPHQQSSSSSVSSASFISTFGGPGVSTIFPNSTDHDVSRPQPSDVVRLPAMGQNSAQYGLISLPSLIPSEMIPAVPVDQSQWTLPLPLASPVHDRQHGMKPFSRCSASPAMREPERPWPDVDSSPNSISLQRSESEAVDALKGLASGTRMRSDSSSLTRGKKHPS